MRNVTLTFLIKRSKKTKEITKLLLAMKKRGFGKGRWNGVGGKVKDESILKAAMREAQEEISVAIDKLAKVAELNFTFPHEPDWDQTVHVFLTEVWDGEPQESEEMRPEWHTPNNLPFHEMWSADILWLPHILKGKLLKGDISFKEGDELDSHSLKFVQKF